MVLDTVQTEAPIPCKNVGVGVQCTEYSELNSTTTFSIEIGFLLPLHIMFARPKKIMFISNNEYNPAKQRRNCDVIQPYQCGVL